MTYFQIVKIIMAYFHLSLRFIIYLSLNKVFPDRWIGNQQLTLFLSPPPPVSLIFPTPLTPPGPRHPDSPSEPRRGVAASVSPLLRRRAPVAFAASATSDEPRCRR
jgi:hypothetical protein